MDTVNNSPTTTRDVETCLIPPHMIPLDTPSKKVDMFDEFTTAMFTFLRHRPVALPARSAHVQGTTLYETFVTINPKEIDVDLFKQKIQQMLKWTSIREAIYVYEQRGIDEVQGIHAHLLVKHTDKRKVLTDKLVRFWVPKYCGHRKHINLQHARNMDPTQFWDDHMDYMLGNTILDNYDTREMDTHFRNENNLENIYYYKKDAPLCQTPDLQTPPV